MDKVHHIDVVYQLIDVLDALGIAYAIGGSMASSAYGPMRFTQDADITVQPFPSVADKFYDRIKDEFSVSEQAMHRALSTRGSFNVIHFKTSFEIDLFIQGVDEFEQRLLIRCRKVRLGEDDCQERCIVSPEDIVLLKLRWLQETRGTSEHQWNDVVGVLAAQGEALDYEYLTHWAEKLGLKELLDRAVAETAEDV